MQAQMIARGLADVAPRDLGHVRRALLHRLCGRSPGRGLHGLCVERERQHGLRSSTPTDGHVIDTIKVGQRPRGIEFTRDGKFVLVAVGDDDTIQMIDTKTQQVVDTLPSGPDPELFTQDAGRQDSLRRQRERQHRHDHRHRAGARGSAKSRSASSPRAWAISPDGKILDQHVRDHQHGAFHRHRDRARSSPTCWSTRARALPNSSSDGSELWVSSEIGGTVSVIDPAPSTR